MRNSKDKFEEVEYDGMTFKIKELPVDLDYNKRKELDKRSSFCCLTTLSNDKIKTQQYQNFSIKPAIWKDKYISYWFDNKDMVFDIDNLDYKTAYIYTSNGEYENKILDILPFDNYNNRHQAIMRHWKRKQKPISYQNNMILDNPEVEAIKEEIKKNKYSAQKEAMRTQAREYTKILNEEINDIPKYKRYQLFKEAWYYYKTYSGFRTISRYRLYIKHNEKNIGSMMKVPKEVIITLILFKDLFSDCYSKGRREKPIKDKTVLYEIINDVFSNKLSYNKLKKKYKEKKYE